MISFTDQSSYPQQNWDYNNPLKVLKDRTDVIKTEIDTHDTRLYGVQNDTTDLKRRVEIIEDDIIDIMRHVQATMLYSVGAIDRSELMRLMTMFYSPDKENHEVARELIYNKITEVFKPNESLTHESC
jgi:hypothetical protein